MRLTITNHAWKRVEQMGLTREQVLAVVADPETDYPAAAGRRIAQRGDLAVCYEPQGRVVITVLPRTAGRYLRPEKQRLRWSQEPERVLSALFGAGCDVDTAAAALGHFGVDATPVSLTTGTQVLHVAALEQLVDVATGRIWPVPDELYLEEVFEFDGEPCRYVPAWACVDEDTLSDLVAAVRDRLEGAVPEAA